MDRSIDKFVFMMSRRMYKGNMEFEESNFKRNNL